MNYQISIARVEIKRNDKSRHSRWFVFPIESLLKMNRSPQGPAGVCQLGGFLLEIIFLLASSRFLLIKNRSSLTTSLVVWTHSTNKESKRVREGTNMLWEQKIASILEILWSRLTGRSMYFDDVAPSIKSTDSKRNLFFFFRCLNQDLMENFTSILSSGRDGVFIFPYIAYIYQTFTLQAGDKDKSCKGRMSPAGWPSAH